MAVMMGDRKGSRNRESETMQTMDKETQTPNPYAFFICVMTVHGAENAWRRKCMFDVCAQLRGNSWSWRHASSFLTQHSLSGLLGRAGASREIAIAFEFKRRKDVPWLVRHWGELWRWRLGQGGEILLVHDRRVESHVAMSLQSTLLGARTHWRRGRRDTSAAGGGANGGRVGVAVVHCGMESWERWQLERSSGSGNLGLFDTAARVGLVGVSRGWCHVVDWVVVDAALAIWRARHGVC